MSDLTDYRNLLAFVAHGEEPHFALTGVTGEERLMLASADFILATHIPNLCPDCQGTGNGMLLYGMPDACIHPNAPTIARLLAIGEAAWTAEDEGKPYHYVHMDGHDKTSNAHTLLAALKVVGE